MRALKTLVIAGLALQFAACSSSPGMREASAPEYPGQPAAEKAMDAAEDEEAPMSAPGASGYGPSAADRAEPASGASAGTLRG